MSWLVEEAFRSSMDVGARVPPLFPGDCFLTVFFSSLPFPAPASYIRVIYFASRLSALAFLDTLLRVFGGDF